MPIADLENKVNNLAPEEKELFERIFYVSSSEGELDIPATFKAKAREYFGQKDESEEEVIEKIRTQKVVKTLNKWTGESALFNPLRAMRPGVKPGEGRVYQHIEEARKGCDFCQPEKYTPADVFGRVKGKYSITATNLAKYDAYNGVVIFTRHNPLEFGEEELSDYIETGLKWFEKVHEWDGEFRYPFLIWNCMKSAGASRVHGHAQVLMGKDVHYGKVSALRKVARQYQEECGRDYFDDLFRAHNLVGLALSEGGVRVLAYLTPVKERETMMIAPQMNDGLKKVIFNTLRCYIDELGTTSFNLSISMPRLGGHDDFPYVVRIVDRGSIFRPTSDMGAMELYGSSVISTDPYTVIATLRE